MLCGNHLKKTENSFENYDNHKGIIISLTTNLIAASPAGCSCSFSSIIPLFILGGTRGEKPENNVKQGYFTLHYIHTCFLLQAFIYLIVPGHFLSFPKICITNEKFT